MTFIAIKIVAAAVIVLVFSVLAERVGPRLAGILMGAPLGALISYYFVGREAGTDYVVASVPHAIAGLVGTLAFTYAYFRATARFSNLSPFWNAGAGTAAGLAVYLAWSLAIQDINFTIPLALGLFLPFMAIFTLLFRRVADIKVRDPARLTPSLMAVRAGGAALLVSFISTIAVFLGPAWSGLLMGFPMTLLPTMLIVHLTYSKEHVHAFLGAFPVGIGSMVVYVVAVSETFPRFGVDLGTVSALAAAWTYLSVLTLAFRWARRFKR